MATHAVIEGDASMNYNGERPEVITKNGKFFDFALKSGRAVIMDYSLMDREIVISNTDGTLSIGNDRKNKKEIDSIHCLRKVMEELTSAVELIINRNGIYFDGIDLSNEFTLGVPEYHSGILLLEDCYNFESDAVFTTEPLPFRVHIRSEDRERFIDQLIFDVLYSKYRKESPQMTLRQYGVSRSRYVWGDVTDSNLITNTIRRCVEAAILRQIDIMNNPALRADIRKLGVNPDAYFAYLSRLNEPFGKEETKPKIVWDYIYYSGTQKLITGKQYMRSFSKNENYSRKVVAELFDAYDLFVSKVFMQATENNRDYFQKSLEFFHLEIYKRIDFIYKLASRLEAADSPVVDKNHALIKRFHPEVIGFYADKGRPAFGSRYNYYRPMLMLEELWQQEKLYEDPMYYDTLQKHHLVRAKVYELFKYHYDFVSDTYDEIASFIRERYNVLRYHDPQKVWIQKDGKTKTGREARVIKALEINEALFGDSGKRKPKEWTNPNAPP